MTIRQNELLGTVASLHLHPPEPGTPLIEVREVQVVEAMGVAGDIRYYGRLSKTTGEPTKRQVSLIGREQIAQHADDLGIAGITPGRVRANIETRGILDFSALIGAELQIGGAVLRVTVRRDPCGKMDAICPGLKDLMMDGRQGVLAEVVKSGTVRVGDEIRLR